MEAELRLICSAQGKGATLETGKPVGRQGGGRGQEVRSAVRRSKKSSRLHKRRRRGSSAATSEESSTARSRWRPAPLRMDHNNPNVPYGSQGHSGYQPQYNNRYMYSYQCPPPYNQQFAPNHPGGSGPQLINPTQVANASGSYIDVDGCNPCEEADLYETAPPVPSPAAEGKRNKVAGRVKQSNFLPDEDVNLVKSWLEISCDAVTSNGQKKERMWQRILQRYNTRRGSYPDRTARSLQSRWDTIKAEAGKFAAYYADTLRENASGTSDADKTTMAAANFASIQKHNFQFMHCWEILKDEPKWQDPKPRSNARSAEGEGFGEETHHGADNEDTEDFSPPRTAARRPMGRDSAKAAKKTANSSAGSAASAEYAARQQDIREARLSILQDEAIAKKDRFQQQSTYNMSLLSIEQEKMQLLREKHEMDKVQKEKEEEERILAIDISKCLPSQQLYYQMLQEEIVEKQAARRRARQAAQAP